VVDGNEPVSAVAAPRAGLRESLTTGLRPASELRSEATRGIGQNALYAARKAKGIRLSKERKVHGRWLWSLQTTPSGSELGLAESALPNP
jgi:hypothetical protein